jgi:hypothetical protein
MYSYYNNTPVYIEYFVTPSDDRSNLGGLPDLVSNSPTEHLSRIKCPYSKDLKDIPDEAQIYEVAGSCAG